MSTLPLFSTLRKSNYRTTGTVPKPVASEVDKWSVEFPRGYFKLLGFFLFSFFIFFSSAFFTHSTFEKISLSLWRVPRIRNILPRVLGVLDPVELASRLLYTWHKNSFMKSKPLYHYTFSLKSRVPKDAVQKLNSFDNKNKDRKSKNSLEWTKSVVTYL